MLPECAIWRFDSGITPSGTPDGVTPGTLDSGFAVNGLATLALGLGVPNPDSVVLAPNGDIMLGMSNALMAFLPNGSLDTSFGSGGSVIASQFPFTGDGSTFNYPGLYALAIGADGNILAGGEINGLFGVASYGAPATQPLMAAAMSTTSSTAALTQSPDATAPLPAAIPQGSARRRVNALVGNSASNALDQLFADLGDGGAFEFLDLRFPSLTLA